MANPTISDNDVNEIGLGGNEFEDKTVLSGETVAKGQVLGKILVAATSITADGGNTGDGTFTALALAAGGPAKIGTHVVTCIADDADGVITAGTVTAGSNTGDGVPGTATPGASVQAGTYTLTCKDATVSGSEIFEVLTPSGAQLADLMVAVAYVSPHFGLTIADGATDFIVGDTFTILMTEADDHAGTFRIIDPDGIILGEVSLPLTTGGAVIFVAAGYTFTITDGATDFVIGDSADIIIGAGSGKLKELNSTNTDGSEIPKYISTVALTTTSDVVSRVLKTGRVRKLMLAFNGSETVATVVNGKSFQEWLREVGIIVITDTLNDRVNPS